MIIDCHGHVSAPAQLWAYKAVLLASRGSHGRGGVKVTDDELRAALNHAEIGPKGHLDALHAHGTDVQPARHAVPKGNQKTVVTTRTESSHA